MAATDEYEDLGFRCGIEIHQQLDTATKLFCNCPTDPGERPDADVVRELRPVPSELGEVDRAAQFEYLKEKQFRYNVYRDVSCLVELDEEPPHPVDNEALETALQAALLMHCDVPDEIHVMRKTVIDGSNTAGFQRTAVVGLDGEIETSEGSVAIEDMELEEDSAGIHARDKTEGIFDLDRLGVPLLEVGTDASIKSPEHAKEVAEKIGMLLRSTGNVKRGLGTIRQDVNVSIEGGARVEIKGFQDLEQMDTLIENEIERQKSLISLSEELGDNVATAIEDVTPLFQDSGSDILERILESEGVVLAFKLNGVEGRMNDDLCPGLHLGKELASYAESQGTRGLIHSDEDLSRYGLEEEFEHLAEEMDKEEGEVICIIAEREDTARTAAAAVVDRAEKLSDGVPEETRTAEETTTRYARPLPGEARMYPETDIPPIQMAEERIQQVEVPETLEDKEERYADMVGEELAEQLIASGNHALFDRVTRESDIDARVAANVLTNVIGRLHSEGIDVEDLTEERVEQVLKTLARGDIGKNQVERLLKKAARTPGSDVEELAAEFEQVSEDEVRATVRDVIDEKEGLVEEQGEHGHGALMGLVMERLENAEGSTVSRILEEELKRSLDG